MLNSENRDILTVIYRLVEKYETVPKFRYAEDAEQFFSELVKDCGALCERFPQNTLAVRLMVAVYGAVEDQYKAKNGKLEEKGHQIEF